MYGGDINLASEKLREQLNRALLKYGADKHLFFTVFTAAHIFSSPEGNESNEIFYILEGFFLFL